MNGEDILFAMTSLGFENYAEALKIYLSKYREVSTVIVTALHISLTLHTDPSTAVAVKQRRPAAQQTRQPRRIRSWRRRRPQRWGCWLPRR